MRRILFVTAVRHPLFETLTENLRKGGMSLDRLVLRMRLEEIRDRVEPLRVAEGEVERRGQQHHDPIEPGRVVFEERHDRPGAE